MVDWATAQRGIFAGESGGDYSALFNYQNRPGGLFENTDVAKMTIGQLKDFTNPSATTEDTLKELTRRAYFRRRLALIKLLAAHSKMRSKPSIFQMTKFLIKRHKTRLAVGFLTRKEQARGRVTRLKQHP